MFPSVEYLIPTQQIVHPCKFLPDVFMLSHKNLSIDRMLKRSFANFSSMENFPYTFAWLQPNNWHTREISENRSHMLKLSQQMHSLEEDVFILLCKIFCKLCLTIFPVRLSNEHWIEQQDLISRFYLGTIVWMRGKLYKLKLSQTRKCKNLKA